MLLVCPRHQLEPFCIENTKKSIYKIAIKITCRAFSLISRTRFSFRTEISLYSELIIINGTLRATEMCTCSSWKGRVLYLLDFSVCRDGPLCVSLVFEPRADGLQRSIGTAPAVVIHPILHVMMITVQALDHIHLRKKNRA